MENPQLGIDFEVREAPFKPAWKKSADKAMKAADKHANSPWKAAVYDVLLDVARTRDTFTTYDVWLRAQELSEKTHDGRAIGIVIKQGQRDGVMEPTGQYFKNPNRHGSPAPIYKSLIYKQDRLQTLLQEAYERTIQ